MKSKNQKKQNGTTHYKTTDLGTTDHKTPHWSKAEWAQQIERCKAEMARDNVEMWWEELTDAEKRFAFDLHGFVRGLEWMRWRVLSGNCVQHVNALRLRTTVPACSRRAAGSDGGAGVKKAKAEMLKTESAPHPNPLRPSRSGHHAEREKAW